jgi:hypothetical protein
MNGCHHRPVSDTHARAAAASALAKMRTGRRNINAAIRAPQGIIGLLEKCP